MKATSNTKPARENLSTLCRGLSWQPVSELEHLIEVLGEYRRQLTLDELKRQLGRLELRPQELQRLIHFQKYDDGEKAIYRCDAFEVRCLSWRSGQRSSIHDHADSRCCVRVMQGVLTNTDFERGVRGRLIARNRFDLAAGELLTREGRQIHQMANEQPSEEPAITLHVYSPPLASAGASTAAPVLSTSGRTTYETHHAIHH